MRKTFFCLLSLAVAPSIVLFADEITAHARPHQIDNSGVRANIFFVDTGSTLFVLGVATGLTPGQTYISLVYGPGSLPGGPQACEPGSPPLGFAKMFVGQWTNNNDGTGVLVAMKSGTAYVSASAATTISVRHSIAPMNAPLQACGEIAVNPE